MPVRIKINHIATKHDDKIVNLVPIGSKIILPYRHRLSSIVVRNLVRPELKIESAAFLGERKEKKNARYAYTVYEIVDCSMIRCAYNYIHIIILYSYVDVRALQVQRVHVTNDKPIWITVPT